MTQVYIKNEKKITILIFVEYSKKQRHNVMKHYAFIHQSY